MSDIHRVGDTPLERFVNEMEIVRTHDSQLPLDDRVCMIDLPDAEAILADITTTKTTIDNLIDKFASALSVVIAVREWKKSVCVFDGDDRKLCAAINAYETDVGFTETPA